MDAFGSGLVIGSLSGGIGAGRDIKLNKQPRIKNYNIGGT